MLVNTLTNVNKWHAIVKYFHFYVSFKHNSGRYKKKTLAKLNLTNELFFNKNEIKSDSKDIYVTEGLL